MTMKNPAWLGLDSRNIFHQPGIDRPEEGLVAVGRRVTIMTQSQCEFTADRLFVKRDCASNFLIHSVFVGCQLSPARTNTVMNLIAEPFAVNFDDLPKLDFEMFDGKTAVKIAVERKAIELLGAPFPLPTLHPSITLHFEVENVGDRAQRFLGAFLGTALWQ